MDETVFVSYCEALSCWEEEQEEKQHLFTITGREEGGNQEQVSREWVGGCTYVRTYVRMHCVYHNYTYFTLAGACHCFGYDVLRDALPLSLQPSKRPQTMPKLKGMGKTHAKSLASSHHSDTDIKRYQVGSAGHGDAALLPLLHSFCCGRLD